MQSLTYWICFTIIAILVVVRRDKMVQTTMRARLWAGILFLAAAGGISFLLTTSTSSVGRLNMFVIVPAILMCLIAGGSLLSWRPGSVSKVPE